MTKNLQTALIQSGYRHTRGVWTKPIAGIEFSCDSAEGLTVHDGCWVAAFDEGLSPTSNAWETQIECAEHTLIHQLFRGV